MVNKPTIYFATDDGHWEAGERISSYPVCEFDRGRKGQWFCTGLNQQGFGGSRREAYDHWRRALILSGTAELPGGGRAM